MWVEDSHAVGQAEPRLGTTIWTCAIAVQGPEHESLPGLGQWHQSQRLLGVIWKTRERDDENEVPTVCWIYRR